MPWYFFSFLSAILTAAAAITYKKTLFKEHAIEFAAVLGIFNAVLSLPLFLLVDYSKITLEPILLMLIVAFLAAVAFVLIIKAMRHLEVSIVSPTRMIGPGVTAIVALAFLGESLKSAQWLGLLLLLVGVYILEMRANNSPKQEAAHNNFKYLYFVFGAILIYALTSNIDRFVLSRYDFQPLAYSAIENVLICLNLLVLLVFFRKKEGLSDIKHGVLLSWGWFLIASLLTIGYRLAQVNAVSMANVGLATAIKDTAPFFTILLGGSLFHESHLGKKILASAVMAVGVFLIVQSA